MVLKSLHAANEPLALSLDPKIPVEPELPRAEADDLSRDVFGLLGIPLDAIDFNSLSSSIEQAKDVGAPYLISTPNVNFLIKSQTNSEFRESLLLSDLCLVDGMPLIWIAKLLGIPIRERIAGSDLFGRLKSSRRADHRLRVFLLGGAEGLAGKVGAKLNAEGRGLECVGVLNPGFGSIEEMSSPQIIDQINAAGADLIAVFFGAEKAQAWLLHNHRSLRTPVRIQFGATINFEAGTVRRAPPMLRSTGFEWLWRVKEEPYLWRRYWSDGTALLKLLVTCVIPMYIDARRRRDNVADFCVYQTENQTTVTLQLSGAAINSNVGAAISSFRSALATGKHMTVDISAMKDVDSRFFGLFLMIRKQLAGRGKQLNFVGTSPYIRRIFRLNRFEFLLPGAV